MDPRDLGFRVSRLGSKHLRDKVATKAFYISELLEVFTVHTRAISLQEAVIKPEVGDMKVCPPTNK